MTAPPSDSRALLDASIAAVGLQVTSENVLAVRDTLLQKAKDLESGLKMHWKAATSMPALGGDPVSADASVAFPAKTHALLEQCLRYVHELTDAAHALDRTARGYGLAESDIADTMHATAASLDTRPAPAPTTEPGAEPGAMDRILNPHLYGSA